MLLSADVALLEEPRAKQPARVKGARDPAQTRPAILEAAVLEFTQKGYGGARINEIARRSGANKRMIYHYFGDKEALYLAALESVYESIRAAEAELHLASRDPVEAMRELTRFTWRYFLAHPEFLSMLATENLLKARHLKRSSRILEMHSPLVATLAEVLRRGVAQRQLRRGVDPVRLYITIASLGYFYLSNRHTLSAIFRRDLAARDELDAWGEHIVDVVLAYLRP
jgi:AcrR family transcriptional regulator